MTSHQLANRLLIIDDHPKIHDAFEKIFSNANAGESTNAPQGDLFGITSLLDEFRYDSAAPNVQTNPQYSLHHANSGEQAVEIVKKVSAQGDLISVAFVDILMPGGMNGIQTTEQLWEIDPNLHIVICSGDQNPKWEKALESLHHRDQLFVLKKPFDTVEVRQLAMSLCGKQARHTAHKACIEKLRTEVQERRKSEESMRKIAHRDSLTDLPNRPYLLEKLNRIVARPQQNSDTHQAILFLDLDNFKVINDSLGHDAGDDLLNQVAKRIGECVRYDDMTTRVSRDGETVRLGGDEFVVLLEQLTHRHDALSIADRIVEKISQPFMIAGRKVSVGTSVGIAFLDHSTRDAHEVLRNADTAMYRAKNAGKGQVAVFDKTMHQELLERLELESKIRDAVENDELTLRYQPIVDLHNGKIRGVEVLTRWITTSGEMIPPDQFIPIIEEIGLIGRVSEWAIERASIDLKELTESLPNSCDPNFYLGFNIARRQLGDPLFYEHLQTIISRTGIHRNRLKIEVNESGDHRNEAQILQNLLNLHDSGIGIQIDDFGKGTSSLTCFQNYPVETVKIDRSFTANITTNHSHSVITQAMVDLAHDLDANIVAEGVESETQLNLLKKWGCDAAQGFLLSEPLDSRSLRRLLQNPAQSDGIRLLMNSSTPLLFLQDLPAHNPSYPLQNG